MPMAINTEAAYAHAFYFHVFHYSIDLISTSKIILIPKVVVLTCDRYAEQQRLGYHMLTTKYELAPLVTAIPPLAVYSAQ